MGSVEEDGLTACWGRGIFIKVIKPVFRIWNSGCMTQHCPEQNWRARKKEAQCKPGLKRSQEGGRIPREDAENGSRTKHVSMLPMHETASLKGRNLSHECSLSEQGQASWTEALWPCTAADEQSGTAVCVKRSEQLRKWMADSESQIPHCWSGKTRGCGQNSPRVWTHV